MTDNNSQPITFHHGETVLHGRLYAPMNATTYPVVILVPGHGIRSNAIDAHGTFDHLLSLIGDHLVQEGIGVLHYNRPGTGGSSGDWRFQTLYDRADEVLTAIRHLHKLPDTQPSHIGILGHSNGGWVAPLVASTSDAVDFIIPVAGPGISLGQQVLSAFEIRLRKQDIRLSDQVQMLGYARTIIELYRLIIRGQRSPFQILRARLSQDELPFPELLDDFGLPFPQWEEREDILRSMDAMVDYDAVTPLQNVRCPVLAIFGEHDTAFDSLESASIYAHGFQVGGNTDTRIHILPKSSHRMQVVGEDGTMRTEPHFQTLVSTWIKQQTKNVISQL